MYKVLFAINRQNLENSIIREMRDVAVSAGIVQHTEAVIRSLQSSHADILLIMEDLPGLMDFGSLVKNVRIQTPGVRIICILKDRPNDDPLITNLVNMGIYDIFNGQEFLITDIVSSIATPHTFRDVIQYTSSSSSTESVVSAKTDEKKKSGGKGLFGSLFHKENEKKKDISISDTPKSADVDVDINTMRVAIQEEADRKARMKVDQIATEMTRQKTQELQKTIEKLQGELTETQYQKKMAEEQSYHTLSELDAARRELLAANHELEDLRTRSTETISAYKEQIAALSTDSNNIDLITQRTEQWSTKEEEYQKQIRELGEKLAAMEIDLKQAQMNAQERNIQEVDVTGGPRDCIIMPEDPADYATVKNPTTHTYLFMGSKHGVGNTTVAMNFAAALASNGFKTLFIEFNERYPLTNAYFEFVSVPRGIDTALDGLKMGNKLSIDAGIIKPHGITTEKKTLKRTYSKLPGAFHFMLFSNNRLQGEKEMRNPPLDGKDLLDLLAYLKKELGYLYIVMDIQPDDRTGRMVLNTCGKAIDQLVVTCNQDPHSIATAGLLLQDLTNAVNPLAESVRVLINQYSDERDMTADKVAKWLNYSPKRMLKVTGDMNGYFKASCSMFPYVLLDMPYSHEYFDIAAAI